VVGKVLRLGRWEITLNRPLVMGVVNVTPDSFSDGGRFGEPDRAMEQADRLVTEGADLIDIGGESTRPGSEPVPVDEELSRVLPVLRESVKRYDLPVSVDTCKAEVAAAVLAEGASVINNIMGVDLDGDLAGVVAAHGAGLIIMHIRGIPRTMQRNPTYGNLMSEIRTELAESVRIALQSGLKPEGIVIDPGIGFGKRPEQNLEILRNLGELTGLGYPVMIGPSRKSFIGDVLGADVNERLPGTVGSVVSGYHYGAGLFRVHDVRPNLEALRLAHAITTGRTAWEGWSRPANNGS
jgi:dihydropteroate synthase